MNFALVGEYLVVTHNAVPFSTEDVDKICDNAQQRHRTKLQDTQKTGYKGIGFKTIFAASDCVFIISGGYCFRFDKNYSKWKDATDPYPWPIIPVWTERKELPRAVEREVRQVGSGSTTFVVHVSDPRAASQELSFLERNPSIMLFLRHVRCITTARRSGTRINHRPSSSRLQLEFPSPHLRELWVDKRLFSTYLISKQFQVPIPSSVQRKLERMSDQECPVKLKKAKTVQLQFAVLSRGKGRGLGSHDFLGAKSNPLFCYLPTKAHFGLPYVVNTDFLLNADRTTLLQNDWNLFLFAQIAQHQLLWVKNIVRSRLEPFRSQVLRLITAAPMLPMGAGTDQWVRAKQGLHTFLLLFLLPLLSSFFFFSSSFFFFFFFFRFLLLNPFIISFCLPSFIIHPPERFSVFLCCLFAAIFLFFSL